MNYENCFRVEESLNLFEIRYGELFRNKDKFNKSFEIFMTEFNCKISHGDSHFHKEGGNDGKIYWSLCHYSSYTLMRS